MQSPVFCALVMLVIMASIGYTYGAICQCFCCSGIDCSAGPAGNITVESCSNCNILLCQSTYNSTCVLINGRTNSTCTEIQNNNGHTVFDSIYSTFIMTMMGFIILLHQKIKY